MTFAIPYRRLWLGLLVPIMLLWPALGQAQVQAQPQDDGARSGFLRPADPNRPQTVYLSLHGGWSFMHYSQFSRFSTFYTAEPDAEAVFDSDQTGGGAIGYRSDQPWRLEFEVAQRSNAFDSIQWNRYYKYGGYVTTGKIETRSYMVNLIGDFESNGNYQIFAGVGVGAAHFKLKNVSDSDGPLFSGSDTSIAGQFLLGVEYALTEGLAVSLSYKIFASIIATNADPGQPEIGGDRVRIPVATSSILLGVSYYF